MSVQSQQSRQNELENTVIQQHRLKKVKQLEHDIQDLHQIFRELKGLVYEQQPMIDTIEYHMEETEHQFTIVTKELTKASTYQSKIRNRGRVFGIISGLVLIPLVGIKVGIIMGAAGMYYF